MPVLSLGHAVLKVRNLERSTRFYHEILGLPIATRWDERQMVFFTLGNHHDLAIRALGDDAPLPDPNGVGLAHVAFKVGETLDELRAMKDWLEAAGVTVDRVVDHNVTYSLYFNDPDGNGIEFYVDVSDLWKQNPIEIAAIKPLSV